jgi:secondary thiamine-phosphate synthase enzyme
MQKSLTIQTPPNSGFVEITHQVMTLIKEETFESGVVIVFVPHTTAGITINENADPNVVRDFMADLERLLPSHQDYYRHYEGNSAAHIKASMMGSSVTVLVEGGRLQLGTWQGIYLCEFDGPRSRRIQIKFVPDKAGVD